MLGSTQVASQIKSENSKREQLLKNMKSNVKFYLYFNE